MIFLSLGSNQGNRLYHLQEAVALLKKRCLTNVYCSIILETEALLLPDSPSSWDKPFLNMIVSGTTLLSPLQLLQEIKLIEQTLGRPTQYEKWSPRIIDIDILLWKDLIVDSPDLSIPHPELNKRPFLIHLLNLMGYDYHSDHYEKTAFLNTFALSPKLVGIVNVTSDSFSDGGKYNTAEKAIEHAIQLAEQGASIIDIGAQSTKPGATLKTPEAEYAILKPVLEGLLPEMQKGKLRVSIDTFWPEVIKNTLENYPVTWINDVSANLDDETLSLIAEKKVQLCIMHSLSIPPSKEKILPIEKKPIDLVLEWAQINLERLLKLGFMQEDIILDPGIGFGKSAYQNLELLKHVEFLANLGAPILVGHSRKSFIGSFSNQQAQERDIETLSVSSYLKNKVDYLRVHNVAEHMRFFVGQSLVA